MVLSHMPQGDQWVALEVHDVQEAVEQVQDVQEVVQVVQWVQQAQEAAFELEVEYHYPPLAQAQMRQYQSQKALLEAIEEGIGPLVERPGKWRSSKTACSEIMNFFVTGL